MGNFQNTVEVSEVFGMWELQRERGAKSKQGELGSKLNEALGVSDSALCQ